NQWNYTAGITVKRLIKNGFVNLALSRNVFDNDIVRYEDNEIKDPSQLLLSYQSRETENKLRLDINQTIKGWKFTYGAVAQLADYSN
ncbi:hypothetical protein ABTK05_20590, partial [Acinetobacter baumannii]